MHVMAPHDPFVFGPNGEEVDYKYTFGPTGNPYLSSSEENKAYLNQLIYLTKILQQTIDKLTENSDNPPIIILQSDTGPGINYMDTTKEVTEIVRTSIFNAYYFPDEKYDLLYHDITPVNSFRVVFDSQFQTNNGLLKDKVFFSTYEKMYTFIEITDFSIVRWLNLQLIKPDLVV